MDGSQNPLPNRPSPARYLAERLAKKIRRVSGSAKPRASTTSPPKPKPRNSQRNKEFSSEATFNNPMSPFYIKRDTFGSPTSRANNAHLSFNGTNRIEDIRWALMERRKRHTKGLPPEDDSPEVSTPENGLDDKNADPTPTPTAESTSPSQDFDMMGLSAEEFIIKLQEGAVERGLNLEQASLENCREAIHRTKNFDKALRWLVRKPLREKQQVRFDPDIQIRYFDKFLAL